jgi:hypothetical protein
MPSLQLAKPVVRVTENRAELIEMKTSNSRRKYLGGGGGGDAVALGSPNHQFTLLLLYVKAAERWIGIGDEVTPLIEVQLSDAGFGTYCRMFRYR